MWQSTGVSSAYPAIINHLLLQVPDPAPPKNNFFSVTQFEQRLIKAISNTDI